MDGDFSNVIFKKNKISNQVCKFSQNPNDTVYYVFLKCKVIKKIRTEFENLLLQYGLPKIKLNKDAITFRQ